MEAFKGQLDRARGGEPEALSTLYRQLLPGVFGSIAARVPDRATAEDLTSDVFVQMVERISRLRASDEASVAAWILQVDDFVAPETAAGKVDPARVMASRTPCLRRCATMSTTSPNQGGGNGAACEEAWMLTGEYAILVIGPP